MTLKRLMIPYTIYSPKLTAVTKDYYSRNEGGLRPRVATASVIENWAG